MAEGTITEQTKEVAVASAPGIKTSNFSWLNSNVIFSTIQIIGLACVSIWFHRKISAVTLRVEEALSRLEEVETAIERHENVLKKVMTLLGKQNRNYFSEPVPVSVPVSVPTSLPTKATPTPVQEEQPPVNLLGAVLGSMFSNPMSFASSEPVEHPPVSTRDMPKIVELSDQDLDAELKSEIGELINEEHKA